MSNVDRENQDIDTTDNEELDESTVSNEAETVEAEFVEESVSGEGEGVSGSEALVAEVEKWKDAAAHARADLDNFRKRMAREKTEAIQYANRSLLEELLPIFDNFEMGLRAAREADGEDSMIFKGMAMVYRKMEEFLSEQGVKVIESDGLPFDPNVHEALKQENSDTVPENYVIYTMRRGYRLRDRVLRAANVVVSSGPGEGTRGE